MFSVIFKEFRNFNKSGNIREMLVNKDNSKDTSNIISAIISFLYKNPLDVEY